MIENIIIPKRLSSGIILCLLPFLNAIADNPDIKFSGNTLKAIEVTPPSNTGLNSIFVINNVEGVSMTYEATSTGDVRWMRFSNLGGAFAEEINDIKVEGKNYTLESFEGDMGYIIYDGEKCTYFWIINYMSHPFKINSIIPSEESNCDATVLKVDGSAEPIHYFTINGRQETLGRDITVDYNSLIWNESQSQYEFENITATLASFNESISLTPPTYCATTFTISGDRFLEEWQIGESLESALIQPESVNVMTEAIQSSDDTDTSNRIENDVEGLGGSAPCEIDFNAYVTDAVIHYEWQMATDEEFENITYRINEQNMSYTFTEEGVTYVRFIGSNNDGSCEAFGDAYTVSIGASELLIPNAFSPNEDGVNDEWKVSYRSLIDFDCWIFDRNGHQIIHLDSPDKGWDGKKSGKYVKPGVYYYVIKATGADGKKYKKSGDINIIRYKGNGASNMPSVD